MRIEAKLCTLALLSVVLTGCGARYSEYRSATEISEGPGMLSGRDGAFVLYSDERWKAAKSGRTPDEDYHESKQFQAFMRWREANRDTPEYREFEQWREWKAYRARKGAQK